MIHKSTGYFGYMCSDLLYTTVTVHVTEKSSIFCDIIIV